MLITGQAALTWLSKYHEHNRELPVSRDCDVRANGCELSGRGSLLRLRIVEPQPLRFRALVAESPVRSSEGLACTCSSIVPKRPMSLTKEIPCQVLQASVNCHSSYPPTFTDFFRKLQSSGDIQSA